VQLDDKPYVLAIYTKYGPEKVEDGEPTLQALSKAVWQAETGQTLNEYEKQQQNQNKPKQKGKPKPDNS
jgi:hypothetical protein